MAVFKKSESVKTTSFSSPDILPNKVSVIGKTLFLKGRIYSDEEVVIEGKVEGKLNIKHKVVVGKHGEVNADINAKEVVIMGQVNGNVKGSYKVEIVPDGVLNGNIISQRVVLAEGAIFKGNIDMTLKDDNIPGGKKSHSPVNINTKSGPEKEEAVPPQKSEPGKTEKK